MKKVVIFGSSGLGQNVYFSLERWKYQVVAFIDNAAKTDNLFAKGMMLESFDTGGGIYLY